MKPCEHCGGLERHKPGCEEVAAEMLRRHVAFDKYGRTPVYEAADGELIQCCHICYLTGERSDHPTGWCIQRAVDRLYPVKGEAAFNELVRGM